MDRKKILKSVSTFYTDPSFFDLNQKEEILKEIPDLLGYNNETKEIAKKINEKSYNPSLRVCYELPVLKLEQSQHLFRKMNYYKYLCFNALNEDKDENQIIEYHNFYQDIRNQLVLANARLVGFLLRANLPYMGREESKNEVISNCFYDLFKVVDNFDWTRGIKFSTYAVNSLRRNLWLTELKTRELMIQHANYEENEEDIYRMPTFFEDPLAVADISDKMSLISKAMRNLTSREKMCVMENFGIGSTPKSLQTIGKEKGLTKERIRQIRNVGLRKIKKNIIDTLGGEDSKRYFNFISDV